MSLRFAIMVLALGGAGCFTTTVRSGLPPGDTAPGSNAAWHHGFALGALEASGPHNLARLCPGGWSEITTENDALTSAVSVLSLFLVTPQRVTVVCAARASAAAERSGLTSAPPAERYPPERDGLEPPPPLTP